MKGTTARLPLKLEDSGCIRVGQENNKNKTYTKNTLPVRLSPRQTPLRTAQTPHYTPQVPATTPSPTLDLLYGAPHTWQPGTPPPRVPSAPPVYPPPPDQPNAGHILAKPRIRPTHQASGHRPITPKHPHRHPQTPLAIPPPHPLPHLQGPLLPPSSPPLASPDTSADSSDTPLHAPGASNHPLTHPRPLIWGYPHFAHNTARLR